MLITTQLKKLVRLVEKQAANYLKKTDVSVGYTSYLMNLYQKDGITQTTLQQAVGFEHPTVVRALDRMARDGLIERRANPNDRRSYLIFLTDKARSHQDIVMQVAEKLNCHLVKGLTRKQCIELAKYLELMTNNLDNRE